MAMYFGTAMFVLCYLGRLTGTECVTSVGILAGLYKVANLADAKFKDA
jgi:hypothetical protein